MQIDYIERQLILEPGDLSQPHAAAKLLNKLLSVMFYPEDETKQQLFLTGQKHQVIQDWPDESEKRAFLLSQPQLAVDLCLLDRDQAKNVVKRTMHSRQGGGKGGLFMRGLVAGTLLQYLRIEGELKGAYDLYQDWAQGFRTEDWRNVEPILLKPASLRKTWEYYLPVAPLWAAWAGFQHEYGSVPLEPNKILHQVLPTVLSSASAWRRFLVEFQHASLPGIYLIPDPSRIWTILDKNNNIFS